MGASAGASWMAPNGQSRFAMARLGVMSGTDAEWSLEGRGALGISSAWEMTGVSRMTATGGRARLDLGAGVQRAISARHAVQLEAETVVWNSDAPRQTRATLKIIHRY